MRKETTRETPAAKAKAVRGANAGRSRTNFEITTANPLQGYRRTVSGYVRGDFGAHHDGETEGAEWHVTHLPTGLCIARVRTAREARTCAERCAHDGPPAPVARGIARALERGIRPGVPNDGCV